MQGLRVWPALMALCLLLVLGAFSAQAAEHPLRVLATTFPIYQITRNITAGVEGVQVDLMIPAQMGCPHDYALTPQDMRKLARTDVLVVNGLGLEEFLGAPVRKANPKLRIIDSSRGIEQLLSYDKVAEREPEPHDREVKTAGGGKGRNAKGHGEEHAHEHHAQGTNPHLFASPRMAALMTEIIARGLADRFPAGAATFTANGQTYGQRLNRLADEMAATGARLANKRIVTQHGVFDYLARDMGLEVVAVVQAHGGQNPSAAEILTLVATIRTKQAGAVFTEPQYPQAVGITIAKEAGIAAARLDPGATGPQGAPLDYYEQVMRANLTTLEQTLGRR